jgi:hypothetical protein
MNLSSSFDVSEDDHDLYKMKTEIKRRTMIIELYCTNETTFKDTSNN